MVDEKRYIQKVNYNKINGQRTVTIPKDWPFKDYVELFPVLENKEIEKLKEKNE